MGIIEAFYPGQGGAEALLQALLGESNRFGKLPYTMYPTGLENRSVFNFDLQSDGGLTYKYYDGKYGAPIYEFGWGLSYTTFSYEWAAPPPSKVDVADLKAPGAGCYDCSGIAFAAKVANTGSVAGDAVVLGFVCSAARPAVRE